MGLAIETEIAQNMFFELRSHNSASLWRVVCKASLFVFFVAKRVAGGRSRLIKIFFRDRFAPLYFHYECKTLGAIWSLSPVGLISELQVHYTSRLTGVNGSVAEAPHHVV